MVITELDALLVRDPTNAWAMVSVLGMPYGKVACRMLSRQEP